MRQSQPGVTSGFIGASHPTTQMLLLRVMMNAKRCPMQAQDLLPNPDEAVVAAGPKPNAVDAVVLGPNEPNENPDVSSKKN